jgi:hypothetical protein
MRAYFISCEGSVELAGQDPGARGLADPQIRTNMERSVR